MIHYYYYYLFILFVICEAIADVALLVFGMRSLSGGELLSSSSSRLNLNVTTSGCRFLAVILNMVSSLWVCLTRPQPARSDNSRIIMSESAVTTRWLQ